MKNDAVPDLPAGPILVVRAPSGLSGDMFVAGLVRLADLDAQALAGIVARLGLPELDGALAVVDTTVSGIAGAGCDIRLPHVHSHTTMADIRGLIAAGRLSPRGRELALTAFGELARAEAAVHGVAVDDVAFHEVGALDSILDVCLSAELFAMIDPSRFVCSPLPVSDGVVACAHGLLSTPAPATLALLEGMPIYGIPGAGETVTPTAAALLRAFAPQFGPWPPMRLTRQVRAYGGRIIPGVPNGAIFALGQPLPAGLAAECPAAKADGAPLTCRPDHHHAHPDHAHGHGHAGDGPPHRRAGHGD
ncbi:MAG: LarC family nickel insertion protein [Desulfovibrionaceae bacterium]|nr:LarC family nickel insertion protein [Desulfovibrionaceae bacterium]